MTIPLSITVDAVINALGAFLAPLCDNVEIVRGQGNRVPPPPGPFVKLTEITQTDLETPISAFDTAQQLRKITGPKKFDIQIDLYGSDAGDWCTRIKTVWRTPYATAAFPDGIKPLYLSDGMQGPLVTGEEQYENRWTLTASMQYNPVVTVTQQSATALVLNILEDAQ